MSLITHVGLAPEQYPPSLGSGLQLSHSRRLHKQFHLGEAEQPLGRFGEPAEGVDYLYLKVVQLTS